MLRMASGVAIMETLSSEAVRSQLEKILAGEGFARNDRISSFLRFVVEQELSGSGNQLKESIIGVEVLCQRRRGRRVDHRSTEGWLPTRVSERRGNEGRSRCFTRTKASVDATPNHPI